VPSGKKPAEAADTIGHLKKPAVLEAYKGCANVSKACGIVGIARDTFYRWLKEDPKFKDDYEAAREQAIELLEDEAMRRAHEGIAKPIFHAGKRAVDVVLNPDGSVKLDPVTKKPIGIPAVVREYSDTLLIFLLKGARPQKYRDNVRQEVSGPNGAPLIPTKIVIEVVPTPKGPV
jgi:transposase-like protein